MSLTLLPATRDYDVHTELVRRLALYKRLRKDPDAQALQLEKCRRDPTYFFLNFLWTYDPRNLDTPFLPFVLYPHQLRLIEALRELEATGRGVLVVEKSRDQGFTEIMTGWYVHRWRFKTLWSGGFGSNLERNVDQLGNPKAIFTKVRTKIDNLPHWLRPPGYNKEKHGLFLKVVNPDNGATITGEAGDNIGRGDRKTLYTGDEWAFIERAAQKEAALLRTSNMKVFGSTPNGNGNSFYFMAHKRESPIHHKVRLFWKDDPRYNHWQLGHWGPGGIFCVYEHGGGYEPGSGYGPKDYKERVTGFAGDDLETTGRMELDGGLIVRWPWYDEVVEEMEHAPHLVAQELDIDYTASVLGLIIPARWIEAAVGLALPQTSARRTYGLDIAGGGENEAVLAPRQGATVLPLEGWRDKRPTATAVHAANVVDADPLADWLLYDSAGMGIDAESAFVGTGRRYRFRRQGVNVGDEPTDKVWPDKRTSKELFYNLKAELWWNLRLRFQRTYEFVKEGRRHDPRDLISIPNDPALKMQLGNVKVFTREDGRLIIETKQQLADRGVPSPDRAEAVVLAFAEGVVTGAFTVVSAKSAPASPTPTEAERLLGGGADPDEIAAVIAVRAARAQGETNPATLSLTAEQAKARVLAMQRLKNPR